MEQVQNIIFDLGNVLVRWDPKFVYDEKYFDSPSRRDWFLSEVCTDAWNEEQDAGRSIVEGTMELIGRFPEWEPAIRDYYGRWADMLRGPIPGSVEILKELKEAGRHRLYALTNWNACLFDIALVRYDFLHWFHGRVVSGEEKTRKPHREFFQVLTDRYGVIPQKSLFIDDNTRNVEAGRQLGYQSILFTDPESLRESLSNYGIL